MARLFTRRFRRVSGSHSMAVISGKRPTPTTTIATGELSTSTGKRSIPYPMFATFDAPSRELCQQRRLPSNTPLQALTLLNDAVFDESARALAKRMAAYSDELEKQLTHGYQLATSRKPTAEALAELTRLYRRLDTDALSVVASVMLNLDAALSK